MKKAITQILIMTLLLTSVMFVVPIGVSAAAAIPITLPYSAAGFEKAVFASSNGIPLSYNSGPNNPDGLQYAQGGTGTNYGSITPVSTSGISALAGEGNEVLKVANTTAGGRLPTLQTNLSAAYTDTSKFIYLCVKLYNGTGADITLDKIRIGFASSTNYTGTTSNTSTVNTTIGASSKKIAAGQFLYLRAYTKPVSSGNNPLIVDQVNDDGTITNLSTNNAVANAAIAQVFCVSIFFPNASYDNLYVCEYNVYAENGAANGGLNTAVPLANPVITGTPAVNQILGIDEGYTSPGNYAESTSGSFKTKFQWQISTDNATWSDIDGATSNSYTPQSSDAGKYIRVLVTPCDVYGQKGAAAASAGVQITAPLPNITAIGISGITYDNSLNTISNVPPNTTAKALHDAITVSDGTWQVQDIDGNDISSSTNPLPAGAKVVVTSSGATHTYSISFIAPEITALSLGNITYDNNARTISNILSGISAESLLGAITPSFGTAKLLDAANNVISDTTGIVFDVNNISLYKVRLDAGATQTDYTLGVVAAVVNTNFDGISSTPGAYATAAPPIPGTTTNGWYPDATKVYANGATVGAKTDQALKLTVSGLPAPDAANNTSLLQFYTGGTINSSNVYCYSVSIRPSKNMFTNITGKWGGVNGTWFGGTPVSFDAPSGFIKVYGTNYVKFTPDTWYEVAYIADYTNKKVTVWINGAKAGEFTETQTLPSITAISPLINFRSYNNYGTDVAYVDNIKIYQVTDSNYNPQGALPYISAGFTNSDASKLNFAAGAPVSFDVSSYLSGLTAKNTSSVAIYPIDESAPATGTIDISSTKYYIEAKYDGYVKTYKLGGYNSGLQLETNGAIQSKLLPSTTYTAKGIICDYSSGTYNAFAAIYQYNYADDTNSTIISKKLLRVYPVNVTTVSGIETNVEINNITTPGTLVTYYGDNKIQTRIAAKLYLWSDNDAPMSVATEYLP